MSFLFAVRQGSNTMNDAHWVQEDYLLYFPDVVVKDGSITATNPHFKVCKYISAGILPEARRCLDSNAEIAALLLLTATVDYMAGFYSGHQSKNTDFKAFVSRYYPEEYHPFVDSLYDQIRCGLMHSLVVTNPWKGDGTPFKIHPNSSEHLSKESDGTLIFRVAIFSLIP